MVDANGVCRRSTLHQLRYFAAERPNGAQSDFFSVCEGDVLRRLSSSCAQS